MGHHDSPPKVGEHLRRGTGKNVRGEDGDTSMDPSMLHG